ncbi:MAG: hypothetical protein NTY46_05810 [Candidatus Sumerlaeota bacterium]|nr:hypothetical protein [Candidatus Sumerlaeota bacterium]
MTDLTTEVKNMKGHFRKSFARMAKEGCASRKNFVKQSKEVVHGLLNAVAADLTGAHRAWFGVAKAKVHPVKIVVEHEIKPQPKAEVKVEAPRHEIKPQPKVEVKVEAPRHEIKPQPKVEVNHEIKPQPKVEVKVEAPRHEIKPEVKPHGVAPKAEAQKQQTFQASGPRQIFTHGKRNKK